ncbi:MAG: hypothetical protein WA123_02950 [Methylotenera sp.]
MNKLMSLLLLFLLPITSNAEETPNQNAEGMKKVQGNVVEIEHVDSSRRGSATTGMPVVDLVEAIFGSNYSGFPIYLVKVNEAITLEVASKESFRIGDCVLVWYDGEMGDSPNLSMLGQAGISKSNGCNK